MATRTRESNFEIDFDDDLDLDPIDFWSKKQRELVTATVDYNLGTLHSLVQEQGIDLSPRYQRRNRWSADKQSALIESFLMNVPVPPIFLSEDDIGVYSVIDGKQRLSAITQFFSNNLRLHGLKVFNDINDLTFFELPKQLQTILRTRPTIRAIIILKQSDADIKHEVFQRLNTGGASLNPQEIRNNAFAGPLNDTIMKLAVDKTFHAALKIRSREKSAIYREMRDAELVLRFMTFRETWPDFSGGVRRHMDAFMESHRRASEEFIIDLASDFQETLEKVMLVFQDNCFQRWQPEKGAWRNQPIASLYDAQMFAFRKFRIEEIRPKKNRIRKAFQELFSDDAFRRSVDSATNTPAYFKARIKTVIDITSNLVE